MLFHRSKAVLLGVAALLSAFTSFAQTAPRYQSLLWRISGGDTKKPSYLYGTMHVSRKAVFHLSEEFFTAVKESDVVALEMDPERWLEEMNTSDMFKTLSKVGMNDRGSDDLYKDGFALSFPDRRSIAEALAQDPGVVNELLYRFTERTAGTEEDTYLDLFIFQYARRSGKPVVGLEHLDDGISKLVLASAPDGSKDDPAREKRMREARSRGLDPLAAMEDSYRTQDLDRMDSLFDLSYTNDRMREHLINERNVQFVEALRPMLRDRSVFAGVGAMHLPGSNGMVELLRAQGYTVEPVHGNVTSRSRSSQREHESTSLPMSWKLNAPRDSAFTIELPTTLYSWMDEGRGNEVLLAADMVNSTHFVVQRIPIYAGIRGLDTDHVLAQVDSALYEGIPGRIEKQTSFTANNGWPGRDVRARDHRGRVVHYRVVVGPFEIFIFSRTGRDIPRSVRDGERAFASIRFNTALRQGESDWTPATGGSHLSLPVQRHVREGRMPIGWLTGATADRMHTVQAGSADGTLDLIKLSTTFQDALNLEQDTFELNMLAGSVVRLLQMPTVVERSFSDQDRTLRLSGYLPNGDPLHLMVALDGPRYDLIAARGAKEAAERCFASYERVAYRTPVLEEYRDTLMHFQARTAATHQELMGQMRGLRSYFDRLLLNAKDRSHPEQAQESTLLFHSTTTPEAVLVEMRRFHRFHSAAGTEEEFWDDEVEKLTASGRYSVHDRRMTGEPEHRQVDLYLAERASSRTIRVAFRQYPGGLHLLRAPADEQGRTTAWVDSFLVSFHADTTFGEGLFVKKGTLLLQWLAGTDSLQRKQATRSLGVAEFTDADVPGLIAAYRAAPAPRNGGSYRDEIITAMGGLQHPDALPFLRERYLAAGDSIPARCAVLEALSRHRTKAGPELFLELILADPPLSDETWRIEQCFSAFHDSLSTARYLFPKAWELLRFPEFEAPVIRLASQLLDRQELDRKDLTKRWPELLVKAKVELRRATAKAKQNPEESMDDGNEAPLVSTRDFHWGGRFLPTPEPEAVAEHEVQPSSAWMPLHVAYHHLLQPFAAEPGVKAYFDGALASDADAIVANTAPFLLDRGRTVPAALWQRLAERDDARLWTYRTLKALGHPELFNAALLSPDSNARAYLFSGWSTDEGREVALVGVEEVSCRLGEGPVHFFTSTVKEEGEPDQWQLMATGFFRDGDEEPFAGRFALHHGEQLSSKAEVDEAVRRMKERVRCIGRTRWQDEERFRY